MAKLPAQPDYRQPFFNPNTGLIDRVWFDYLVALDAKVRALEAAGISGAVDVDVSGISNGEVLIWNSTSGKFEAGAN